MELLDSRLDTTKSPPRRMGSFNRSIAQGKRALDLDPSQLVAYAGVASVYGMSAGFLDGIVGGRKKPQASLGADLTGPKDVVFQAILTPDSIVFLTDSQFRALPVEEQARDRRRAADAGAAWTERWLIASPNDPEAHLWASRFAEYQSDYTRSLAELNRALALGPESGLETLPPRRMSLLELTGQYSAAQAIADSIVSAGGVRNPPFHVALDRSRPYVIAIYLRS
jgi:tetratricopeptide (TPR) repeat protein